MNELDKTNTANKIVPNSSNELFDTMAAWQNITRKTDYAFGSEEYQKQVSGDFANKHQYGRAAINQQEGPSRGSVENLVRITANSFRTAFTAMRVSDDVAKGAVDKNTARLMKEQHRLQAEQYTPAALHESQQAMQQMTVDYDKAKGFSETMAAIGSNIYDTAAEIVNNPEGVLQVAAQSSGNMAPIMAGTVLGAKVGAAVGPEGAVAGGIVGTGAGVIGAMLGTLTGSLSVEAGSRFIEEVDKELQTRKLQPTEANYINILQDKAFTRTAFKKARLKAAGTAFVDMGLSVVGGKIASAPFRRAAKMGRAAVATNASKEIIEGAIRSHALKITKGAKLKAFLQATATEMASEPFSELTGQLAVGDKIQTGELAGEFLGGIGSSVGMAAIDKAVFSTKLASGVTQAAAKVTKKKLSDAAVMHGYRPQIKEGVETGEVDQYLDPADPEKYNPVVAIEILRRRNLKADVTDVEHKANHEKAKQLVKGLFEQATNLNTQIAELEKQQAKDSALPVADQDKLTRLQTEADDLISVGEKLIPTINKMAEKGATSAVLKAKLEHAQETSNSHGVKQTIKEIFNSKSQGQDINQAADLPALIAKEQDPDTKEFLISVQELAHQRQLLQDSIRKPSDIKGKKTKAVANDIFHGGKGFTGIDNFMALVMGGSLHNKTGDILNGAKGLVKFANAHQQKIDVFTAAHLEANGGPAMTDEQRLAFEEYDNKSSQTLNPKPLAFSHTIIANMQQEVDALTAAANVALNVVDQHGLSLGMKLNTVDTKSASPSVEEFQGDAEIGARDKLAKAIKSRTNRKKKTNKKQLTQTTKNIRSKLLALNKLVQKRNPDLRVIINNNEIQIVNKKDTTTSTKTTVSPEDAAPKNTKKPTKQGSADGQKQTKKVTKTKSKEKNTTEGQEETGTVNQKTYEKMSTKEQAVSLNGLVIQQGSNSVNAKSALQKAESKIAEYTKLFACVTKK